MRIVPFFLAIIIFAFTPAMADPWTPLSNADEKRYQQIFAAQEKGDWSSADKLIGQLQDRVLLGYVLEQRYMHPVSYKASYPELQRWLSAYADHPDANDVYKLAKARQSRNLPPRKPSGRPWRSAPALPLHPTLVEDYANPERSGTVPSIERRLRSLTRKGQARQALNYLNHPKQFNALTRAQTDRARGWVAAAFYYNNELVQARSIAEKAADRSPELAVLSQWIAGLVAWRQDDPERAYKYFSAQAQVEYQEDSLRSAAGFWAARAALATGRADEVTVNLAIAAQYPLTMYGQLALAQLGVDPDIEWRVHQPTQESFKRLSAHTPRFKRTLALAQVGLHDEAEIEMKWTQGEIPSSEDAHLMAFARAAILPSAEMMIASQGQADRAGFEHLRSGLFPVPDYVPNNGFEVDRAILYGLIRQESKFMTGATSYSGARGLMQLMPRTASYVSDNTNLSTTHSSTKLYDPGYNMQLGQSYVDQLLTRYNGGRKDLLEMAISYNWGPGNYNRWRAEIGIDDPLLMIESVPDQQARHFAETVVANMWVYRDRLNEPAPARDTLAAGGPATYHSVSSR